MMGMSCLRWMPVVTTVVLALADSAVGPPESPPDGEGHLATKPATETPTSGIAKDVY